MKNFIIKTPYNIKQISPISTAVNQFGVTENFYLINSGNIKELKDFYGYQFTKDYLPESLKSMTLPQIEKMHSENIAYAINRDCIAIIDKPFRLAKFMQKDNWQKLKTSTNKKVI